MPRFFMPDAGLGLGRITIAGRDAEHIRVLRMREGETMTICDGRGTDYAAVLLHSNKSEAEAEILSVCPCPAEPSIFTTVYCGLPKGDKTDYIIQKSVEAGASEIVFFDSERVIAKPDTAEKKLERYNRISEEAAKQSGRGIIPLVRWMPTFEAMLDEAAKCDAAFFMYETGERVSLKSAMADIGSAKTAAIITGAEGGFELIEAESARAKGISICAMGARILRCETAPIVALSALMLESGNLGT